MAYSYSPKIRVTGPAGPATTYDLSAWSYVTVSLMQDSPLIFEKEMLDMSIRQTRYGTRRTVTLSFTFPTAQTSNETDLATILTRALDDGWVVELSLDGGTIYRDAVLSSYDVGDIEGKKIGRQYSTTWTVVDRQDAPVAVMGGSW